jgi:hypothetical protein
MYALLCDDPDPASLPAGRTIECKVSITTPPPRGTRFTADLRREDPSGPWRVERVDVIDADSRDLRVTLTRQV